MPTESSRKKFIVIGHIVESDNKVRHYLKPVATQTETGPAAGAVAGSTPDIITSKLDTLKTDTVIEVVTSWSVVLV